MYLYYYIIYTIFTRYSIILFPLTSHFKPATLPRFWVDHAREIWIYRLPCPCGTGGKLLRCTDPGATWPTWWTMVDHGGPWWTMVDHGGPHGIASMWCVERYEITINHHILGNKHPLTSYSRVPVPGFWLIAMYSIVFHRQVHHWSDHDMSRWS